MSGNILRSSMLYLALAGVASAQAAAITPSPRQLTTPADPLSCAAMFGQAEVMDQYQTARTRVSAGQAAPIAEMRAMTAPPPPPPATPVAAAADAAYAPAASLRMAMPTGMPMKMAPEPNYERYAARTDNAVQRASEQPVSTFSIDVDTGSYSNVRRMWRNGQQIPADAVRAEEFINYFDYGHPAPTNRDVPFRVTTELAPAPWNNARQLLMIGIKGYDVPKQQLPPSNLVFLVDTSGSMYSSDKLPLLQQSLCMMLPQLREQDRVSLVAYAGSAGLVLAPTPGNRTATILDALKRLQAGGSTNGGAGIQLAYATARNAYIKEGVNRVILATDGDFNVGMTGQNALETLVADQRKSGIALTTLGFGQGNYNDEMAERLADVGNGNHAYIDSLQEARKVLVEEMQSTLLTIANDVKIQVEFNPAHVSEYRLIGYENRLLNREDFSNDNVDAGDIGAGHQVTALYEITPVGSGADRLPPLRYAGKDTTSKPKNGEVAHLRLRYKLPGQAQSRLIETPVMRDAFTTRPSESLRFASAVAAYADLLRGGTHIDGWTRGQVAAAARGALGADPWGLRAEFVEMAQPRVIMIE